MEKTAFLIIDMQNGLLQRQVYNKQALKDNINCLLDMFHTKNNAIIFFRHTNKSFSKINTDEWEISNELRLLMSDVVLNKTHSSVFKEKQFIALLNDKDITNIVISGLVSNGCVQSACIEAKNFGFNVTLVSDAHSTWSKNAEQVIIDWNTRLLADGIMLLTTEELLISYR